MAKKNKYFAKKVTIGEIQFDSKIESEFYKYLKKDQSVKSIELQPRFEILKPYKVECKRCNGFGQVYNRKTGNYNKCSLCKGKGKRTKRGAVYTADFRVKYIDGHEEVIDVKGGRSSRDFPLRRKLFEMSYGKELVIVRKKNGTWERE